MTVFESVEKQTPSPEAPTIPDADDEDWSNLEVSFDKTTTGAYMVT